MSVHVIIAAAGVAAGLIVAVVLRLVLRRYRNAGGQSRWRALAIDLIVYMVPWVAVIAGTWVAVLSLVAADSPWRSDANHVLVALVVLAVTLGLARAAADAGRAYPALADRLAVRGAVVRGTRQIAFAEARIEDEEGRLVSRATGTFLLHRV